MKRITLLILLCSILLINCDSKNDKIDDDNIKQEFTLNDILIEATETNAAKIGKEYLIGLENKDGILLLATTDTIEANYETISATINDNDSLVFSHNLNTENKLASAAYITDNKAYISNKQGNINITKDENHRISGSFSLTLRNVLDEKDILTVKNGVFNNLTPENVQVDDNQEEVPLEISTEVIQNLFNSTYLLLDQSNQQQFLIDALYTNQVSQRTYIDFENHTVKPDNTLLTNFWNAQYQAISDINTIIENANKAYTNSNALNTVLAEAFALRAHVYSSLVNWFGNIPLVVNSAKNLNDLNKPFSKSNEVQNQIISDLNTSIQYSFNLENKSKINTVHAKVLLAKTYFNQNKYQEALNILEKIDNTDIDKTIFSLDLSDDNTIPSFDRLINKKKLILSNNAEIILTMASCYNELGNLSKSKLYAKKIDATITEDTLTQQQLSDIIYNLWIDQTSKNGNRFYILKSLNRAIDVLTIQEFQLILPIPQNEIQANVNAEQNPGY